jgi:hypothetical protein
MDRKTDNVATPVAGEFRQEPTEEYRPAELFTLGSAVELLQGTYGTYNDITGYYTYG